MYINKQGAIKLIEVLIPGLGINPFIDNCLGCINHFQVIWLTTLIQLAASFN